MKTGKRLLCLLLTVALSCTVFAMPALAANGEMYAVSSASEHNGAVSAKAAEVAQKYGLNITYPTYDLNGVSTAAIYPETLDTLDMALSYVTPYLVATVSQYYYDQTGQRLKIAYRYGNDNIGSDELTLGGFDDKEGLIVLYIPKPGQGAYATGDAPLTIVHEFGHALHLMLEKKHGVSLESQWVTLNGSHSYNPGNIVRNPSNSTFASGYAATSYYEDFAETFAYGFVCNRAGLGIGYRLVNEGTTTAFGQKMASVDNLLKTYFPEATTAQANLARVYTTPSRLSYQGLTLYGDYLQYVGYAQPRYFPKAILERYSIREQDFTWHSGMGGWAGKGTDGRTYYVFPDGTHDVRNASGQSAA